MLAIVKLASVTEAELGTSPSSTAVNPDGIASPERNVSSVSDKQTSETLDTGVDQPHETHQKDTTDARRLHFDRVLDKGEKM